MGAVCNVKDGLRTDDSSALFALLSVTVFSTIQCCCEGRTSCVLQGLL